MAGYLGDGWQNGEPDDRKDRAMGALWGHKGLLCRGALGCSWNKTLSYTSSPYSSSCSAWAIGCLTHISGAHGMVEQDQVLHEKDFIGSFHQLLKQYSGQANEPGEGKGQV